MPYSYATFKKEIKVYILDLIKEKNITKILDVGPGAGTYSRILKIKTMDCVEIHEPYIEKYNLREKYTTVYNMNIMDFPNLQDYELIIMGDILEHLTVEDAQKLIEKIKDLHFVIAVPYKYRQGAIHQNVYERHLQPDLTIENMGERYPSLQLLIGNEKHGYYINKNVQ